MSILENYTSELLLKGYTARQIDELNNFVKKVEDKIKDKNLNQNENGDMFILGLFFMYDLFYQEHNNSLFLLKDEDIIDTIRQYKTSALKIDYKFDDEIFEKLIEVLREVLKTRKSLQN